MRILLLNLGPESTQEVNQALSGQGYEITTGRRLTGDKILALSPEVLITEATPSDLSCCGVISQIKASPDPRTPDCDDCSRRRAGTGPRTGPGCRRRHFLSV